MPPLIPVEQLTFLSELLSTLRTRNPLGLLKTRFKTLTANPIYDDLFASVPRGDSFFRSTKKAQKAALTHFLENQTSLYLSAALEALQKKDPLSAHTIVSDLDSFNHTTLRTINTVCSRFLSRLQQIPKKLSRFQKAIETALSIPILDAWAKEIAPGECRKVAVGRIKAFITIHQEIELDLTGLELHSLPDIFHLPVFQRLTHLYLGKNRLTTLPHLKPLMNTLKECVLSENFFQETPDMRGFSKLSLLDLSHNPFLTLNQDYILGLSPLCNLILKIPERLNDSLDLIAIANASKGDERILLEAKLESNKDQIDRILRFLYHPFTEIPSLSRITDEPKMLRTVIPWLSLFMEDMIDYKDKETTDQVKGLLRSFLEEVESNPLFEHLFLVIIQEAMTTCIDGRTLSLVHLSLAKTESSCDVRNLQATFDTFVKLGICKLLEEYALTKISLLRASHPEIDTFDREIILSYLLEMREHFNLPLEDLKMMFKACTQLTKDDFEEAKTGIEAILSDPKKLHQLLIKNVSWVNLLKIHHPDDYQKVEDALASIEDLSLLKTKREEFLIRLSEKSCMTPSTLSIPYENMPLLQTLAAWGLNISSKELCDLFYKYKLEKETITQIIYNYNEIIFESDYLPLSRNSHDTRQKTFDPLVLLQVIKDQLLIELPTHADKRQRLES